MLLNVYVRWDPVKNVTVSKKSERQQNLAGRSQFQAHMAPHKQVFSNFQVKTSTISEKQWIST